MKTKIHFLTVIAMIAMLLSCEKIPQPEKNLTAGDAVPAFTVTMNDGTTVSDQDFAGSNKRGFVVFFDTSCGDCAALLPELQKLYDKWTSLPIVLISRGEGAKSIEKFWKANNLTMPYSAQKNRAVYSLFAISGIPRIYDISDGRIIKDWDDSNAPTFEVLDAYLNDTTLNIDVD